MQYKNVVFLAPLYNGSNHSQFLGIGYLSSFLKVNDYNTLIIDVDALYFVLKSLLGEISNDILNNRIKEEINNFSPNVICISINTANLENGIILLEFIRDICNDTFLVVGGPHITTCYNEFSETHGQLFDAAIIGEGEVSLLSLCNWLNGSIHEDLSGIIFQKNSLQYKARKLCNINILPYPDRDGFFNIYNSLEKEYAKESYNRVFYTKLPGFNGDYARVVASRGCANFCDFCSPTVLWRDPILNSPTRRIRNPESILQEVKSLINKGITFFYFDDPTFPIKSNLEFFTRFESIIKSEHIEFNWGSPICLTDVDIKYLERLRRIGFTYTYFGLEDYRFYNISKYSKIDGINNAISLIKACSDLEIHCDASYQIGLYGDNFEDIKKSINWVFDNNLQKNIFFSLTAIWPGTPLARKFNVNGAHYEPLFKKEYLEQEKNIFFYKQGNNEIESFYSNCSGTYHFVPIEIAIEAKYYIFDCGLKNRFEKNGK